MVAIKPRRGRLPDYDFVGALPIQFCKHCVVRLIASANKISVGYCPFRANRYFFSSSKTGPEIFIFVITPFGPPSIA
jgi:hypothetical protein